MPYGIPIRINSHILTWGFLPSIHGSGSRQRAMPGRRFPVSSTAIFMDRWRTASDPDALLCQGDAEALGDMPWVPVEAVARVHAELLKVSTQELHAVAPYFQVNRGHPVGLTRAWAGSLIALQGDVGAKHLLRGAKMIAIDWPSADVLQDVDVPEDLA